MDLQPAPWIQRHIQEIGLILNLQELSNITQAAEGDWSSVHQELANAMKTQVGRELFSGPFNEVLDEEVGRTATQEAKAYFAAVGPKITAKNLEDAMKQTYQRVQSWPGIEGLTEVRKVLMINLYYPN